MVPNTHPHHMQYDVFDPCCIECKLFDDLFIADLISTGYWHLIHVLLDPTFIHLSIFTWGQTQTLNPTKSIPPM